jgi:hypothetical protein
LPCGCSHPALHPLTQQYPALQHQQVQQHARTCSCNWWLTHYNSCCWVCLGASWLLLLFFPGSFVKCACPGILSHLL